MGSAGISPLPNSIHTPFLALCQLLSFLSFILSMEIKTWTLPGGMGGRAIV